MDVQNLSRQDISISIVLRMIIVILISGKLFPSFPLSLFLLTPYLLTVEVQSHRDEDREREREEETLN